ncbi:stage II sporulation protein M [Candidatus Bathyarchaeota archaeon]|nr:stage II sporulation protein M [Candidatus Bathyarchaeota archaeon]
MLEFQFWKTASSRTKRIYTIIAIFILSIIITFAGALTPLTMEQAEELSQDMENLVENLTDIGVLGQSAYIFGNNMMLCLSFFVPFIGPFIGAFVLYSTGVVIAAQSISMGVPPALTFILLFIFPFAWMEFIAYSTAISQSIWLTRRILKRKWRSELVNTCIMIAICAVILLAAAFIEAALLKAFSTAI